MSPYAEFLRRLFEQNQFAVRYELDAMSVALRQLGLGPLAQRTVIVGGTNGKGTTSAALNAIALDAGRTSALYTSPHLVDFRERVRVGGAPISAEECVRIGVDLFARYSGRDRAADTPRPLSYFELTTLLAARRFTAQESLDLAVLEVGMGGRLDAVNSFDADACVVTGVSLDHQEYLGGTIEKIAFEKAGIARPGIPLFVHAEGASVDEICRQVRARGVEPTLVEGGATARERNVTLAAAVYTHLFGGERAVHAARAELRMRWPGRQQRLQRSDRAPLWLDGAHNAESMAEHVRWLGSQGLAEAGATFVVGTSPPRDPAALFAPLLPHAGRFVVTRAASRGHSPAIVAEALVDAGARNVVCAETPSEALLLTRDEPTVVVGSLYLVGDVLAALGAQAEDLRVFE